MERSIPMAGGRLSLPQKNVSGNKAPGDALVPPKPRSRNENFCSGFLCIGVV
jgi:hypothetical protein